MGEQGYQGYQAFDCPECSGPIDRNFDFTDRSYVESIDKLKQRIAALEAQVPVEGVSRLVSERLYEAMADAPRLARIAAMREAEAVAFEVLLDGEGVTIDELAVDLRRKFHRLIAQHEEPSKPGEEGEG